jgi:hypothetical protein
MNRLDQLPENRITATLARIKADQRQLKASQLAGSDTVVMRRIFSANAADITFTTVHFNDKAFYLIFTPDDVTFNTSIIYKMEYTYSQGSGNSVTIIAERQKVDVGNVQRWLFTLECSDSFPNSSVGIKFFLWASGPGTMTTQTI